MRFFHIFLNCIFETHFFQIFNSNYYNPSVAQLALINVGGPALVLRFFEMMLGSQDVLKYGRHQITSVTRVRCPSE